MQAEWLLIFLFSILLVGLLVSVGGYRPRRSRRGLPVDPDLEKETRATEDVGIGLAMLFFFLILFPLLLAGNAWLTPYGPVLMGVSWLPLVFFGLLLTLLIAAIAPREPGRRRGSKKDSGVDEVEVEERAAPTVFGTVFFILLILAVAAFFTAPPTP